MAKPIIKTMAPFDQDTSYTLGFVWKGAMAYNNRLYIYDAETMNLVYDHIYPENYYRLTHEIPAGTLRNGKKYAAQVQVIDINGTTSDLSDKYYFWVLANPVFYFNGLSDSVTNEIDNSSYIASLYYEQANGDTLLSCQFFLYNTVKEQLDASEIKYNGNTTYTYRSFENDTNYYLRATGVTKKGIGLDTGFVPIYVRYTDPSFYARMYAKVNEVIGTVDYSTNIVNIETDLGSAAYDYDEGYVDLIEYDKNLRFEIATDSIIYPHRIIADYIDLKYQYATDHVDEYNHLFISNFSEITSVEIEGNYKMIRFPQVVVGNYMEGEFSVIDRIGLSLNGTDISNLAVNNPLRRIPNAHDKIIIDAYGQRVFYKSVSCVNISGKLTPSSVGTKRNNYGRNMTVLYYQIDDLKKNGGIGNLVCDNLPVNVETTCVFSTNDGRIGIQFDYTETLVNNETKARNWLNQHPLKILYPLDTTKVIYLSPVNVPHLKSNKSARYSTNFKIPGDTTTIAVKMKEAYKNAEIMRVQTEGMDAFVLSSMIFEDNEGGTFLRYKLRAFGAGTDYILYSEPLTFRRWDIVTLYIRRKNGIYQIKTYIEPVDPNALHNVWYLTSEPRDMAHEKDLWFNTGYPTSFVDKNTAVRFYQDEEPTGASSYSTLWIGG